MAKIPELSRVAPGRDLEPSIRNPQKLSSTTLELVGEVSIDLSLGEIRGQKRYKISGLEGRTAFAKLVAAAYHPDLERLGILDPALRVPVANIHVEQVPNSPNQAYVDMQYGTPEITVPAAPQFPDNDPDDPEALPSIELQVAQIPTQTIHDVHGELITPPNYTIRSSDLQVPPVLAPQQIATVEYFQLATTVIFRRLERESPGTKSAAFNGTTNQDPVFGDPAHYWRASIFGASQDAGETYETTYTYEQNPNSWLKLVVWQEKDGTPGVQVTLPEVITPTLVGGTGNGTRYFQMYKTSDFLQMGLPASLFGVT